METIGPHGTWQGSYPVGADNGTFKDPAVGGNLPGCASYVAGPPNQVQVTSAPCTIDHFDFTLHNGVGLQILGINNPSATVTITNNKFLTGTGWPAGNNAGEINSNSKVKHIIRYNTIDKAFDCGGGDVINQFSDGDFTIEYNIFKRTTQTQTNSVHAGTFTIRYNVSVGQWACGSHADWFILNGTVTPVVINSSFNTIWADQTSCCASALCYLSTSGPGSIQGSCTNETYITAISTAADGPPGNGTVAIIVRVEPFTGNGPFSIKDNYMDITGTLFPIAASPVSGGGSVTVNCSGNKNLQTGASITAVAGSGGYVSCR